MHPHGFVAAAHFHPYQTERFEVLEGRLGLRVGDDKLVATPGDVAVVTPRTVHRFWNAGDEDARFTVQVRRALQFESLRLPNPLRLAVIARAHFDTVRLPFPPAPLQRAALARVAPLGKALGYRETVTLPRSAETVRPHGRPVRTYERGRPHKTAPALESRRPPR